MTRTRLPLPYRRLRTAHARGDLPSRERTPVIAVSDLVSFVTSYYYY